MLLGQERRNSRRILEIKCLQKQLLGGPSKLRGQELLLYGSATNE
jgi:hypothetical protein